MRVTATLSIAALTAALAAGAAAQTRSTAPEAERDRRLIDQLQHNWALEMDGVAMYNALAEREKNPERRTIFHKLGETERRRCHPDRGLGPDRRLERGDRDRAEPNLLLGGVDESKGDAER